VIVGLILGLAVGSALAFLRLQLDPRLRSPSEVQSVLGMKVLSVVPPTGLSWRLRRAIQKAGG
jgi:capsular polysaccharide biosynthesis protein